MYWCLMSRVSSGYKKNFVLYLFLKENRVQFVHLRSPFIGNFMQLTLCFVFPSHKNQKITSTLLFCTLVIQILVL